MSSLPALDALDDIWSSLETMISTNAQNETTVEISVPELDAILAKPDAVGCVQPESQVIKINPAVQRTNRLSIQSIAGRIAETDKLVRQIKSLEEQYKACKEEMNALKLNSIEVAQLYDLAKSRNIRLEKEMTELRERNEELHEENVIKKFEYEQNEAKFSEYIPGEVHHKLVVKYLHICQKLKVSDGRDRIYENKLLEYCRQSGLKISDPVVNDFLKKSEKSSKKSKKPNKSHLDDDDEDNENTLIENDEETNGKCLANCLQNYRKQLVSTATQHTSTKLSKASQCKISTVSKGLQTDKESKSQTIAKATQCEIDVVNTKVKSVSSTGSQCDLALPVVESKPMKIMKSQATQHKSSTITRATSTDCFIKKHHVGTMFPDYQCSYYTDKLLEDILQINRANVITPILETNEQATNTASFTTRTVGTCTTICNLRKPVDYLNPVMASNLKRSISRPSSSIKYEAPATPHEHLTNNFQSLSTFVGDFPIFLRFWQIGTELLWALLKNEPNFITTVVSDKDFLKNLEYQVFVNNCQIFGKIIWSLITSDGAHLNPAFGLPSPNQQQYRKESDSNCTKKLWDILLKMLHGLLTSDVLANPGPQLNQEREESISLLSPPILRNVPSHTPANLIHPQAWRASESYDCDIIDKERELPQAEQQDKAVPQNFGSIFDDLDNEEAEEEEPVALATSSPSSTTAGQKETLNVRKEQDLIASTLFSIQAKSLTNTGETNPNQDNQQHNKTENSLKAPATNASTTDLNLNNVPNHNKVIEHESKGAEKQPETGNKSPQLLSKEVGTLATETNDFMSFLINLTTSNPEENNSRKTNTSEANLSETSAEVFSTSKRRALSPLLSENIKIPKKTGDPKEDADDFRQRQSFSHSPTSPFNKKSQKADSVSPLRRLSPIKNLDDRLMETETVETPPQTSPKNPQSQPSFGNGRIVLSPIRNLEDLATQNAKELETTRQSQSRSTSPLVGLDLEPLGSESPSSSSSSPSLPQKDDHDHDKPSEVKSKKELTSIASQLTLLSLPPDLLAYKSPNRLEPIPASPTNSASDSSSMKQKKLLDIFGNIDDVPSLTDEEDDENSSSSISSTSSSKSSPAVSPVEEEVACDLSLNLSPAKDNANKPANSVIPAAYNSPEKPPPTQPVVFKTPTKAAPKKRKLKINPLPNTTITMYTQSKPNHCPSPAEADKEKRARLCDTLEDDLSCDDSEDEDEDLVSKALPIEDSMDGNAQQLHYEASAKATKDEEQKNLSKATTPNKTEAPIKGLPEEAKSGLSTASRHKENDAVMPTSVTPTSPPLPENFSFLTSTSNEVASPFLNLKQNLVEVAKDTSNLVEMSSQSLKPPVQEPELLQPFSDSLLENTNDSFGSWERTNESFNSQANDLSDDLELSSSSSFSNESTFSSSSHSSSDSRMNIVEEEEKSLDNLLINSQGDQPAKASSPSPNDFRSAFLQMEKHFERSSNYLAESSLTQFPFDKYTIPKDIIGKYTAVSPGTSLDLTKAKKAEEKPKEQPSPLDSSFNIQVGFFREADPNLNCDISDKETEDRTQATSDKQSCKEVPQDLTKNSKASNLMIMEQDPPVITDTDKEPMELVDEPVIFETESPLSPQLCDDSSLDAAAVEVVENFKTPALQKQKNYNLFGDYINNYHEDKKMLNQKTKANEEIIHKLKDSYMYYLMNPMIKDELAHAEKFFEVFSSLAQPIDLKVAALAQCLKVLPEKNSEEETRTTLLGRIQNSLYSFSEQIKDFHSKLMFELESLLFSETETKAKIQQFETLNLLEAIMFLTDLKQHEDQHPAKLLMAKCLYYYGQQTEVFVPLVLCILTKYSVVLPNRHNRHYDQSDALVTVIKYILMSTKYDMQDEASKRLLSSLRFEYYFEPFSPTREEVKAFLLQKLSKGERHHLILAFLLFTKRFKPEALYKFVLLPNFYPLGLSYYKQACLLKYTPRDASAIKLEAQICLYLEIFSLLVKQLPLEYDCIGKLFRLITLFLSVQNVQIQESAAQAILRLQAFGYANCYNTLCDFQPFQPLQLMTKSMMLTFIHNKPITFWKSLQKQYSYVHTNDLP